MTDILRSLGGSYSSELKSTMARLDDLIGEHHWLSVGTYKEAIIRRLLANKLPRRYEVGTGFVITRGGIDVEAKKISRQLDVLVWDAWRVPPLFREGDFVIVSAEACVAAIEVKGNLDADALAEAIENLDSVIECVAEGYSDARFPYVPPFVAVFAFALDDKLQFPASIINKLWSWYTKNPSITLTARQEHSDSRRNERQWTLSWIDLVAVLKHGVVNLEQWHIDGTDDVVYVTYDTAADAQAEQTYAFLERRLLIHLLGDSVSGRLYEFPALARLLLGPEGLATALSLARFGGQTRGKIRTIGSLDADAVQACARLEVKPRAPYGTGAKAKGAKGVAAKAKGAKGVAAKAKGAKGVAAKAKGAKGAAAKAKGAKGAAAKAKNRAVSKVAPGLD